MITCPYYWSAVTNIDYLSLQRISSPWQCLPVPTNQQSLTMIYVRPYWSVVGSPRPPPTFIFWLVLFLERSKLRIPFLGLSLLRNRTETLATQAIRYLRSVICDVTFWFEIISGCRPWPKNDLSALYGVDLRTLALFVPSCLLSSNLKLIRGDA